MKLAVRSWGVESLTRKEVNVRRGTDGYVECTDAFLKSQDTVRGCLPLGPTRNHGRPHCVSPGSQPCAARSAATSSGNVRQYRSQLGYCPTGQAPCGQRILCA